MEEGQAKLIDIVTSQSAQIEKLLAWHAPVPGMEPEPQDEPAVERQQEFDPSDQIHEAVEVLAAYAPNLLNPTHFLNMAVQDLQNRVAELEAE